MTYRVIHQWEFDADTIALFDLIDSEDPIEDEEVEEKD